MGYGSRSNGVGGKIETFWPDDTDEEFYVEYGLGLGEIIARAQEKWGQDIGVDDVHVSASHIHTDCLYYDQYDAGDYNNFVVVSKIQR